MGSGHLMARSRRIGANILDFESPVVSTEQRLVLLHDTISQALLRARQPSEKQELEYAHQDCHCAMNDMSGSCLDEAVVIGSQQFRRLERVAAHYESFLERVNRRYWWIFCLIGIALLAAYFTSCPAPTLHWCDPMLPQI